MNRIIKGLFEKLHSCVYIQIWYRSWRAVVPYLVGFSSKFKKDLGCMSVVCWQLSSSSYFRSPPKMSIGRVRTNTSFCRRRLAGAGAPIVRSPNATKPPFSGNLAVLRIDFNSSRLRREFRSIARVQPVRREPKRHSRRIPLRSASSQFT